jgi:hypothetical protein
MKLTFLVKLRIRANRLPALGRKGFLIQNRLTGNCSLAMSRAIINL